MIPMFSVYTVVAVAVERYATLIDFLNKVCLISEIYILFFTKDLHGPKYWQLHNKEGVQNPRPPSTHRKEHSPKKYYYSMSSSTNRKSSSSLWACARVGCSPPSSSSSPSSTTLCASSSSQLRSVLILIFISYYDSWLFLSDPGPIIVYPSQWLTN